MSEIENVFQKHELIDMIVVLLRQNRLVAYIKTNHNQKLTEKILEEIKLFASKSLTHYMMPK